jgi:hypothetical protein
VPCRPIGAIAQLVEHLHGMQGVSGSNPLGSIGKSQAQPGFFIALVSSQVPSQTR